MLLTVAVSVVVLLASLALVARRPPTGLAAAATLTPQPINMPSFPVPSPTIDGWINSNNQTAIRQHAWDLWAGINSITPASQGWPIWETWYSDTEVLNGPPAHPLNAKFRAVRATRRPVHRLTKPRQFEHQKSAQLFAPPLAAATAAAEPVVVSVKANVDYAQFVWSNNYYKPAVLWNIEKNWPPSTAAVNRMIKPFPAPAIGLKPVFQVVRGPQNNGGITVLPYWLGDLTTGPTHSTTPTHPTPGTWNQCVVVKTGSAAPPPNLTCQDSTAKPTGIVGVNQFYNFALNAAEVATMCGSVSPTNCPIKVGDYAVLVGMHMTTKEDDNWTWQTFWWNYNQPFPYGAPPANIPAPFNNYAMCTAYSMTVDPVNSVSGKNVLCYNPYLETSRNIPDGVHSNCMSCHSVASYGSNPNTNYPASYTSPNNYISPLLATDGTPYFNCQTQTDFSWLLADSTGSQPPLPACTP